MSEIEKNRHRYPCPGGGQILSARGEAESNHGSPVCVFRLLVRTVAAKLSFVSVNHPPNQLLM